MGWNDHIMGPGYEHLNHEELLVELASLRSSLAEKDAENSRIKADNKFLHVRRGELVIERDNAQTRVTELEEVLGLIRDKSENYIVAGEMKLPPHIHVEGLRGGMEEILRMATSALEGRK